MKNDTKYSELIGQYLSGNISQSERKDLFAWVEASVQNKAFFEEMVNLWSLSERYEDDFETDTTKAWKQLNAKLKSGGTTTKSMVFEAGTSNGSAKIVDLGAKNAPKTKKVVPFYQQLLKIAAVFLIVVGIGAVAFNSFSNQGEMMVMDTKEEEQKELVLPDGSKVWLNENTTFSYAESFDKREVFLKGEAFFDVKHLDGKTFEIFSGDTKVLVVGTSFNVRAYEEEAQVEVTVETGIVKVSKKEQVKTEKQITAGQSAVVDKQKGEVKQSVKEISNAASWKKKSLTFGGKDTVQDVIDSFERYYDIKIEVQNPAILDCGIAQKGTGEIPNPKLEDMITIVQVMLNLEFIKKGDIYEVRGKGCK